jgi:hypothetical protein
MITPSYSMTATERVLPRLALDFTTAALDPRITFTRSGDTATVTNSSGVIVAINADLPRFDYNPTTLAPLGLLIEESRTNVLLNSLIDGTSLTTQSVVVTAAARTLSFYGTGQIVLSGAASATVTGTGAYPARTVLTFTPSAGTLTLTVTGTVQFAQLELGSFATSFIPTAASQVTRTTDVAVMTGTNFSDWYNASEGAFQTVNDYLGFSSVDRYTLMVSSNPSAFSTNSITTRTYSTVQATTIYTGGAAQMASNLTGTTVVNTTYSTTIAYKLNNSVTSRNTSIATVDTVCTIPTVAALYIGGSGGAANSMCGHVQKVMYWPQRLTNSEVQAFSK